MSDLIYQQNLEKAIQEKYGEEAIKDPRSNWDEKREKDFLVQKKELSKSNKEKSKTREEADGFLVRRKLLNRNEKRTCPVCKKYSFQIKDDLYIKKFECCYSCFVKHVEGREEKWEEKKEKLLK